ncbi:MAG TPA: thioredoxin domain-containing protein [Conexibacter sp.]|nr:thioredoxin domain-containing protein [Conexibacter sp.]
MTRNLKISVALVAVLLVGLLTVALVSDPSDEPAAAAETIAATTAGDSDDASAPAETGATVAPVLRPDSHRLSVARDGRVTLVEFLDFECESCGALYPLMEELREQYDGRVTFAIRYFPLPGHANAGTSALAVEAAARQGALEPMYRTMFETQAQWGEQQESKAPLFREFASRLGLDMRRFDRDVAAEATAARVLRDQQDGTALGIQGTPALYLNGRELTLESAEQLRADIDAALAESE